MGYDYSLTSTKILTKKGIPHRHIDLDKLVDENTLAYQDELTHDLGETTNILAIRILEYIDPRAQLLLIWALIEKAKPGSVYFIINMTHDKALIGTVKPNYIPSFFGARTDMQFKKHIQLPVKPCLEYPPDEVLIVQKFKS